MSVTFSIHAKDKTEVASISDGDCFFVATQGSALMIWGEKILWFRDKLNELYPPEDVRTCEFCNSPATTTEQDELGNACACCEDHAQTLAAKKPERAADEWYDQTHKSGDK